MFNWILSTSLEKHYRSSSSPVFWRISPNSQENTCLYDERDSGADVFTDVLEHRHQICSIKNLLLIFVQFSKKNTCVRFFFFNKVKICECSEIFRNTYFEEHLRTAACVWSQRRIYNEFMRIMMELFCENS